MLLFAKTVKIIKEIDLNAVKDPYEFEIKTSDGHSKHNKSRTRKNCHIDADCADKICVNTGYISDSVIPIVFYHIDCQLQ